ncbi:hypothetical protein ABZ759_32915 [Streptomyces sp. NPDC047860]|uniref:hypothetical protein n=1 Tax=Streptomyces sp. NPDC047860 TaxID=3155743 RepID=UPI003408032B
MSPPRDLDGRAILPLERIEALARVLDLRKQAIEADDLPYREGLAAAAVPGVQGAVVRWLRSGGDEYPIAYRFFPCKHGVVADRVQPLAPAAAP